MTARRAALRVRVPAHGGHAGFSLIELLAALATGTLALAAVATLSTSVLTGIDADTAAADQQQRARGGLATLIDDVTFAGGGFAYESDSTPGWDLPAIVPDRTRATTWAVSSVSATLSTLAGRRSAAHAVLAASVPAGAVHLDLVLPRFCATATCGFAAGDDILLHASHGRMALAVVRAVAAPLSLDVVSPLAEAWEAGTTVSGVALATYATRADPATGLLQLTRARGSGPATAVVDYLTGLEVDWRVNGAPPRVVLAPDGTEAGTTEGPRPPVAEAPSGTAWPPGENCTFERPGGGIASSRLPALGSEAVAIPLGTLSDGPWCPSPAAPTRWDADLIRVAEVRVTLRVAVAASHLRLLPAGPWRSTSRLVPDLAMTTTVRRGRRGLGV